MNEKDKNKNGTTYDMLQDTQYLLLGLEESEEESYALADILAEFGSEDLMQEEPAKFSAYQKPEESSGESAKAEPLHPNVIAFPGTAVQPDTFEEKDDEVPSAADGEQETEPSMPRPLTMEDIVASTVDAVKAEEDRKLYKQRRRLERDRKKREKKRRVSRTVPTVQEEEAEQDPKEAAVFHKRRWQQSRRDLLFSVPVMVILWLPWLLEQMGIAIPYYSASAKNETICLLSAHALLCILCWGVFRAAVEEVKALRPTCCTYAVLTNLAALMDEAAVLLLSERTPLRPLGSVAAVAMVAALWGLKGYHRGMWDTFRIAAMGEPSCVADRCESGIARGRRRREGFVLRANMGSTAERLQRFLLPVLAVACAVFAWISSVDLGKGSDFFRCWSVAMCASCSLVFPMAYRIPLGRVARRLNRNGSAIAGHYGASVLASGSRIVVTDSDLFPNGSVSLDGIRLYGEERVRAVSYTATLAIRGGGIMGRMFEAVCRSEHISCQPLEHFHIHDDNGLSGMIRGETVLVGTPLFMRHKAVRLPARLPVRTAICLAVDGELTAIFALKYQPATPVEIAMRALSRNRLQLVLATRDGNLTAKRLKEIFGADGKAVLPEISDRLALSDPEREAGAPNGLLYRDGMLPFVEMTALSRRLCQMVKLGNCLSLLGSVVGALVAFYLCAVGRSDALTPVMVMFYQLLWTLPMLPLLAGVDKM